MVLLLAEGKRQDQRDSDRTNYCKMVLMQMCLATIGGLLFGLTLKHLPMLLYRY